MEDLVSWEKGVSDMFLHITHVGIFDATILLQSVSSPLRSYDLHLGPWTSKIS